MLSHFSFSQNIAINSTGAAATASAGLDIAFSNRGLLIPRVSLSSTSDLTTITSPATGLMVYNTNAAMTNGSVGMFFWNGLQWFRFYTYTGTSWLLAGNTLTGTLPASPTEFIGTLNDADLIIKTSGNESNRITSGGALFASGDLTNGVTPTSGAGTRMMWIPAKGAFRAGKVAGTQWNNTLVGTYSFAGGLDNIVEGTSSSAAFGNSNNIQGGSYNFLQGFNNLTGTGTTAGFAVGNGNSVYNTYNNIMGYSNSCGTGAIASFTAGYSNSVFNNYNVVFGNNSSCGTGSTGSFTSGYSNVVNNDYSTVLGYNNSNGSGASGAFVAGYSNVANMNYSSTLGYNNSNGSASLTAFTTGYSNVANGDYAVAFGYNNSTSSVGSVTCPFTSGYANNGAKDYGITLGGYNNNNTGVSSIVMGRDMTVSGDYSCGISLDLVVSTLSQANSMAIMQGKLGISTVAPLSTLHVNGSMTIKRTSTAANYTITTDDIYVGVSSTAAARTITLPSAATVAAGKLYIIKDESGGAATNNITIARAGTDLIEGAVAYTINTNYGFVRLMSIGGTSWVIW